MDLDDVKELLQQKLHSVDDDDIKDAMQVLLDKIETHNALDHDFVELLRILAEGDSAELHKVDKYRQISDELDQDATVIYFKSAGLFRVYDSSELEKYFVNRVRTNYKNQKEIFEVVNDGRPQKIVIIIDSRDKKELSKIKKYILEFAKEIGTIVSAEDLVVFDNEPDETYEIVVRSWVVANATEKTERVQQLLKYISKKEKNAKLSNKLTKVTYSDIPEAAIVKAPGIKKLISAYTKELDGFVSNMQGNIYITVNNIVNNGTMAGGDIAINNMNANEGVIDFVDYLENAQLEWYRSGNIVNYSDLYQEYLDNVGHITKCKFTKMYENVLFKKGKRAKINGKRIQQIKIL